MLRLLPILVFLPAAASAAAQEQMATIGRFVDAGGTPVAGATITFATSPPRVHDAFAPATVVTAETDADGRYRAQLRSGRAYSAWAIGPDGADGRAASAVREGVIAGNVVDFAEGSRRLPPGTHIDGLEALGTGPWFAVVRIDALHQRPIRRPVRADGSVDLPPLPFADMSMHLTDAAGAVVVPRLDVFVRNAAVPALQPRTFRVRDEKGAPIPDAIVTCAEAAFFGRGAEPFGSLRTELTTLRSRPTDDEGRTELRTRQGQALFLARADGFATSATGALNGHWFQDGNWTEEGPHDAATEVTFTLHPAPGLRGRIHRGERALVDLGVQLSGDLRFERNNGGATESIAVAHTDSTRTDAAGAFAFASVPQQLSGLQLAIQPPDDDAVAVLFLPRESVPQAPIDVDLATWPVVTFRGIDTTGGPAGDLRVIPLPGHTRIPSPDLVSLPADRGGRVRAQLEPGTWFVFATDGIGVFADIVTVPSGEAAAVPVRLEPLARMAGSLRDQDGRPIAGCGFAFQGMQSQRVPDDATSLELLLRHHAMTLERGLTARVRTSAEGRFELRYLVIPGVTVIGNPAGHADCRIELRAGAPDELELRSSR